MKKRKLLIILITSIVVTFFGCEKLKKDYKLNLKESYANTLYDSIGYWHNLSINSIYNYVVQNKITNYKTVRNLIYDTLTSINSTIFNLNEIKSESKIMDSLYLELDIVVNDTNLLLNSNTFTNIFDDLYNKNKISLQLKDSLINITNDIANSISAQDFLDKISKLQTLNWSDSDEDYVNILVQVVNSSYDFWINEGERGVRSDLGIVWADAAGALYGMIVPGGVFSIIEGALFSTLYIINQDQ